MSGILRNVHEFFYTLLAFPRAWRFMVNHRLWVGLRQYGWVARMLVAVALLIAGYLVLETMDWMENHRQAGLVDMAVGSDGLVMTWLKDAYESLSEGALSWVTLILLEVVIYHFMRQTLKVILKKSIENAHTFRPFLDAQLRMIKVSTLAFILESIIVEASTDIFPGLISGGVYVVTHSFFLGLVIADNYNEQFGLSVTQSRRNLLRNYVGICLGLGFPLMLMLQVPLFGTVLGPLVTSVTAAIVLRERSDLHIVGYQMSEKERKKAAKKAEKAARKAAKKAAKQRA